MQSARRGAAGTSTESVLVRAALYQPSVLGKSYAAERSALAAAGGGDVEGGRVFAAMSLAKLRWQKAVSAIVETRRLQSHAQVLCKRSSPPAGGRRGSAWGVDAQRGRRPGGRGLWLCTCGAEEP